MCGYFIFALYSQAPVEIHRHPSPFAGLHLDHWTVCSGGGGESLCLSLCHCQCVSGERGVLNYDYTISYFRD